MERLLPELPEAPEGWFWTWDHEVMIWGKWHSVQVQVNAEGTYTLVHKKMGPQGTPERAALFTADNVFACAAWWAIEQSNLPGGRV